MRGYQVNWELLRQLVATKAAQMTPKEQADYDLKTFEQNSREEHGMIQDLKRQREQLDTQQAIDARIQQENAINYHRLFGGLGLAGLGLGGGYLLYNHYRNKDKKQKRR